MNTGSVLWERVNERTHVIIQNNYKPTRRDWRDREMKLEGENLQHDRTLNISNTDCRWVVKLKADVLLPFKCKTREGETSRSPQLYPRWESSSPPLRWHLLGSEWSRPCRWPSGPRWRCSERCPSHSSLHWEKQKGTLRWIHSSTAFFVYTSSATTSKCVYLLELKSHN